MPLLATLRHDLDWVRRDTVQSMEQMQDAQFRGALTTALKDSDAEVRDAAQAALVQLNHRHNVNNVGTDETSRSVNYEYESGSHP